MLSCGKIQWLNINIRCHLIDITNKFPQKNWTNNAIQHYHPLKVIIDAIMAYCPPLKAQLIFLLSTF